MCQVKALKLHKTCSTPLEPSIIYVEKNGENIGVCEKCWTKIADKDWELGNSPKLTMEQVLSDETRFGKNPTLTVYKERGLTKTLESGEEENE